METKQKEKTKNWLRSTFTDVRGNPSFKRQILFLLVVSVIVSGLLKAEIEFIKQLVLLAGSIGLAVASEQFAKQ